MIFPWCLPEKTRVLHIISLLERYGRDAPDKQHYILRRLLSHCSIYLEAALSGIATFVLLPIQEASHSASSNLLLHIHSFTQD